MFVIGIWGEVEFDPGNFESKIDMFSTHYSVLK